MFEPKNQDLFKTIIYSNSPWINSPNRFPAFRPYRREAYFLVEKELTAKHGMAVLIKGPRRVGKTEIQRQLIANLLGIKKVNPKSVLYLTFDDAQILAERPEDHVKMVQGILDTWAQVLGYETYDDITELAYCFFDEVQAVTNWANLVKNRVERNPNVRIVLSGSAAHSIFEKALKTLMGRVTAVEVSTFSFREFLEMRNAIDAATLDRVRQVQKKFERDLDPAALFSGLRAAVSGCEALKFRRWITQFLADGGFPQLWGMTEEGVERAQFIDENYVRKVTLEDLMLLQKINKPELYERLLRHLFARPGQEYNQNKVAGVLGTTKMTLGDAMRLLEQASLLIFVEKFSLKAEPLKLRNLKIYPIDMMLTSAMTKIVPSLEADVDKGVIAESLVAQTVSRLRNLSSLAFMQSKDERYNGEIDFFLRADMYDCPIEVKYQSQIRGEDTRMLRQIVADKHLRGGLLIVPEGWVNEGGIYSVPLWAFMLLA